MSLASQLGLLATRIAGEINTIRGESSRRIFGTKTELNSFSGSPGMTAYVIEEESEYLRLATGWVIWNKAPTDWVPTIDGLTVGNGVWTKCLYSVSAGVCVWGMLFTFGTTSTFTAPSSTGIVQIPYTSAPGGFLTNPSVQQTSGFYSISGLRYPLVSVNFGNSAVAAMRPIYNNPSVSGPALQWTGALAFSGSGHAISLAGTFIIEEA